VAVSKTLNVFTVLKQILVGIIVSITPHLHQIRNLGYVLLASRCIGMEILDHETGVSRPMEIS
jgi:hypothetical protein